MSAIGKKLHHFVPCFYLKAWAQKRLIYCLQNGDVFRPNLQGVASQNYFYRLEEISPEDARFIHDIIEKSPDGLRKSHEGLLQALMLPHTLRRRLQEIDATTPESERVLEQTVCEMNENLHTAIEDDFRRHLEALRMGDLSFLQDDKEAALFYWGLSVQYTRTNHIKQSERSMPPERFARYLRVANPLMHIVAINVGRSLYAERRHHTIILIENPSSVPFVTADQPVINLAANPTKHEPPEKF